MTYTSRFPTPGRDLHNRASVHVRGIFAKRNHLLPRGHRVLRLDGRDAVDLGWGGRFVVLAYCGVLCWPDLEVDGDVELQCAACRAARAAEVANENATATADGGRQSGHLDVFKMPSSTRIAARVTGSAVKPKPGSLPKGYRTCVRRAALCPSKGNAS